jgi:PAS domain S-box-containing protein
MDDTDTPPFHVLVAESDERTRCSFKASLERRGHCVTTASNPQLALRLIEDNPPDIVITDMWSVSGDGFDLIEKLRLARPRTPIIVTASAKAISSAIAAMDRGAWDCLRTPVADAAELDIAIKRNVGRARVIEANRLCRAWLGSPTDNPLAGGKHPGGVAVPMVPDALSDWDWWTAPDGQFLYCSPACLRITGYSPRDFLEDPALLDRLILADERERVRERLGFHESDTPGRMEFRITHHDGSPRWIGVTYEPFTAQDGTFLGCRGSSRDITERKALETQVLRLQREESLGRLASGIIHDLNNILLPIMLSTGQLESAKLSDQQRECLDAIRRCSEKGSDMLKHLLQFCRGAEGDVIVMDPAWAIRDVTQMISGCVPKNVSVRTTLPDTPLLIEGSPTQLHQVVLNLCLNARDAMPYGGSLVVGLDSTNIEAGQRPHPPGAYVVMTVSDTGTGISPEVLDRIFDPFFTTKAPGHGTGLGLSTVHTIVAGHHGFIDVDAEQPSGTTFRVFFPRALGRPDVQSGAVPHTPARRGAGRTIMVVDDEPDVRDAMWRVLQLHGYRVLLAESGAKALELYAAEATSIDAVFIDVWMPKMDGVDTTRRLARLDPQARVIAISGHAELRKQALQASPIVKDFMVKPLETAQILSAIQDAGRLRPSALL